MLRQMVPTMFTPAARLVIVVQTWIGIGISPMILLLIDLYGTGRLEPAWLIPLPVTFVIAWHGLQSRLPAFVALLSPATREAIAARALAIGYGVGLTLATAAMTAWAMP